MRPYKSSLLSSTVMPAMVAVGLLVGSGFLVASTTYAATVSPCAAKNP